MLNYLVIQEALPNINAKENSYLKERCLSQFHYFAKQLNEPGNLLLQLTHPQAILKQFPISSLVIPKSQVFQMKYLRTLKLMTEISKMTLSLKLMPAKKKMIFLSCPNMRRCKSLCNDVCAFSCNSFD